MRADWDFESSFRKDNKAYGHKVAELIGLWINEVR
jgi:hypothetical protein